MKKLPLFLLLFLNFLYAKQDDYSIIIKKPFESALFSITQDYDRTLSAVGFSNNYKSERYFNISYNNAFDYLRNANNSYGKQIELIKVDAAGEVLIDKTAHLAEFNRAVAVVKTPQNGYIVGGYTQDGLLLVLKLDASGHTVFIKKFGTKNYNSLSNLILLRDGGVLAVGSSVTTRDTNTQLFETGLGLNDIYVTRFSKNGQTLWSKKYGTTHDDQGIDAVEAQDGSLIVLSLTKYEANNNLTLMRLSENGNKIWLKHYKSDEFITPKKILKLRDNNFVVVLSERNSVFKEQIRLIKFDLQKNILIDQTIPTIYSSALNDIKEFSNSNLMGVGFVKDTYNTDGLVMMLDGEFNLLCQEHFGTDNFDKFFSVTIMNDSLAGVAGVHTDNNSQESNMWITKFKQNCTMAQKSTNSKSLYEELKKIYAQEISRRQLIIHPDLRIELTGTALYFKIGQYKLTAEQKHFLNIFSHKLMPFLLRHRSEIKTLEVNGHTSSEWDGVDFSHRYVNNEKLSLNRAFSTIQYIFLNQKIENQKYLTQILKGSGLSYRKKVLNYGSENKEKSRRVTFKIVLEK